MNEVDAPPGRRLRPAPDLPPDAVMLDPNKVIMTGNRLEATGAGQEQISGLREAGIRLRC